MGKRRATEPPAPPPAPADVMDKTAYAATRQLTRQRVSQLLRAGMPQREDGLLDAGACDAWRATHTRKWVRQPKQLSARAAARLAAEAAAATGPPPTTAAVNAVHATLREHGHATAGAVTLDQVRLAAELIKVQKDRLIVRQKARELVDRRAAIDRAFAFARAERDAFLQFPAGVADELGAALEVDARRLYRALEQAIRAWLARRAAVRFDLGRAAALEAAALEAPDAEADGDGGAGPDNR